MRRQPSRAARRQTRFEQFEERLALTAQAIADIVVEQQIEAPSLDLFREVAPTLNDAHDQTGLTSVRNSYGFTGRGQTVAVIDTGIAWDHVNLGGGYGSSYRVVGGYDFAENDADPYDDPSGYHGTHVAGIIGSDHSTYSGVAPEVDMVGLRVFNDAGGGVFSWVESALQWVHDHRNDYENPITAVNLSLGADWNSDTIPGWAMLEDEFAQLEADGIFIAVAAGNSFADYNTPGLSYPAASPYVVPVMSVDASNELSDFSQRHSRALAAPGESIASTVPDHLFGADGNPNDFASASGTSMASPYVAGASVLLREAMDFVGQTNITQDDIYDVLYDTADVIYDAATSANYRSINLDAAFASLMPEDDYGSTQGAAHNLGTITTTLQSTGTIGSLSDADFFTFTAGASGTMSMSIDQTHYLDTNIQLVGGGGELANGTFTFDVVSGQSYTFSLQTNDGIGHYTLDYELESAAIDLGTIHQQVLTGQSVDNSYYQVTAQQAGIFTIEALFEHDGGNVDLTAYTTGGSELGSSSTTGDSERIDLVLDANETIVFQVSGQNSDVMLRLTNLVQQSANGFTITGTSGVDTVSVDINGRALMVNDVSYSVTEASQFATLVINGGNGSDVLNVNGSSATETATYNSTSFSVAATGFSLSTTGFTNISMAGGAADSAVLNGTSGNESLMATSTYSQMDGSGFRFIANGFGNVAAYASTGTDTAVFYDSSGDDRFYSTENYGLMRGPNDNFYNYAEGFDTNYAYSQNGGTDYAYFYDSSGADRFYSTETYGLMRGPSDNFYNYAEGFDRNYAYAQNGGNDMAYFYDSSGDDRFYSTNTYGLMRGPSDNFYNYAEGFDRNYAFSQNGGNDMAYFYDSSGDDRFYSTNTYGLMRGPSDNFYNYAEGFDRNYAFSQNGGFDMAYFYDSTGDDRFYATSTYGLMRGPSDNFYNYAEGFDRNYAFAQGGGFDQAYFYDSAGDDLFYATDTYGLFRDVNTTFYSYAESFDRLYADSSNGGNDNAYFYDSSGKDLFYRTDSYALFRAENSQFYHYAEGFDGVRAYSQNGGNDEAFLYDVGEDDQLTASGDDVYLSDAGGTTNLEGFYRVVAENKSGETASAEVDAVDFIFEQVGDWE